jgi:hypothetical protein
MKVKFINIGKSEECFEDECKVKLTKEWLYKKVKPYILSSVIEFYNLQNGNVGVFVGGVRQVGEIEING